MGFFSDLKEDLNQAVTELNPDAASAETAAEETKLDMEALLDNIDETVAKVSEEPVKDLKPAPKFPMKQLLLQPEWTSPVTLLPAVP